MTGKTFSNPDRVRGDFLFILDLREKMNPGFRKLYGHGVTRDVVENHIDIRPIPDSLISLYSCACGFKTLNKSEFCLPINFDENIIPGFSMMSIFHVQKEIDFQRSVFSPGSRHAWKPDMIPFLDGGGYHFHVRTLKKSEAIFYIDKESDKDDTRPEFWNLEAMMRTIRHCYSEGIYFLDEYGSLTSKTDLEIKIWSEGMPRIY
jgi:hypothetical protein